MFDDTADTVTRNDSSTALRVTPSMSAGFSDFFATSRAKSPPPTALPARTVPQPDSIALSQAQASGNSNGSGNGNGKALGLQVTAGSDSAVVALAGGNGNPLATANANGKVKDNDKEKDNGKEKDKPLGVNASLSDAVTQASAPANGKGKGHEKNKESDSSDSTAHGNGHAKGKELGETNRRVRAESDNPLIADAIASQTRAARGPMTASALAASPITPATVNHLSSSSLDAAPAPVPEPSTWVMLALGLLALGVRAVTRRA